MDELYNKDLIWLIKIILSWVTLVSIILEIIFFPSVGNLAGCIMMVTSYFLFTKIFFKRQIIECAPFSFFMFLSMFLYRYLPLPALIFEGKGVSYGMENPVKTFFLETFLFCISSIAFYFSTRILNNNNILKRFLYSIGFYKQANEKTLWVLGILGCIARILSLAMGQIETGNVIGRILMVLFYYMYAPVILFFPCLYKINCYKKIDMKNKIIWVYLIFISILNFATNSRNQMLTPFAILGLLLFLSLVISNTSVKKFYKPSTIIKILIVAIVGLNIMSEISKSMLINRNIRDEISFTELIANTFDTLTSENMDELWQQYNNKVKTPSSYEAGWTEEYVDNFILNRFCNIRITDETLYLSERLYDYTDNIMLEDFKGRIITALPQPLINMMGIDFNKEKYYNSRGDALYVYSGIGNTFDWGGYRVTSHLADGLATFGIFYFVLQFIMWYFVMTLLNSYSIYTKKNGRIYSIYGLLTVYVSLLMFRNANGMIEDVLFCLRVYWQELFLFLIVYKFVNFISRIKIR